jgi:hypothetical protein
MQIQHVMIGAITNANVRNETYDERTPSGTLTSVRLSKDVPFPISSRTTTKLKPGLLTISRTPRPTC